jgi:putative ABC transport system ATP-binding protein
MIEIEKVTKVYEGEGASVTALGGIDLQIQAGEFVAVTGPSGCGKSTLLHLLGGLDKPTSGKLRAAGVDLHTASPVDLTDYRRRKLGIIFQFFNLLPTMTLVENVELPLLLQKAPARKARERALELLNMVDMETRAGHFPHQLSGGQMQRAAIARALVHQPDILLADEPTGNLDSGNTSRIIELLRKIASQTAATLVVVTHSETVAQAAERQVSLLDGKITNATTA